MRGSRIQVESTPAYKQTQVTNEANQTRTTQFTYTSYKQCLGH